MIDEHETLYQNFNIIAPIHVPTKGHSQNLCIYIHTHSALASTQG